MHTYESLFIIRPELGEDKIAEKIAEVEGVIKKNKGSIISVDNWGKKRLAYKIQKVRNGIYVLITYKILSNMVSQIEKAARLKEHIIKFGTIRLREKEIKAVKVEEESISKEESENKQEKV